jgi:predicted aminopeptidase
VLRKLLMTAAALTLAWGLGAAALCLSSGCTSLAFYAQAANGHLDLIQRAKPVADVLADAQTPEPLRKRLALSQRMTLKTWCFPVMGCVGYRGYFNREAADELAAQLKAEGWEVSVYGVPAYSTLGWSNWVGGDPLLNTFMTWSEGELAALIFHEITHQLVYVADDTTFNESFATAVERLGGRRWLAQHGSPEAQAQQNGIDQRRADFRELTQRYRSELLAVYASASESTVKQQRKAALMAALRADYATLKTERWAGYAGYDKWFANANNASLGVLAAYNELVPDFERLFEKNGQDFTRFYAAVQGLAALPKEQRRAKLAHPP